MPATPPSTGPDDRAGRADVELRLPADSAYVSVLRSTTASLAARLDFTIDDIEDLRIAVGEASALVLAQADDEAELSCRFHLAPGRMRVTLAVPSAAPAEPDRDGFAWQVLTTLATHADLEREPGTFGVRLTMASSVLPGATGAHG